MASLSSPFFTKGLVASITAITGSTIIVLVVLFGIAASVESPINIEPDYELEEEDVVRAVMRDIIVDNPLIVLLSWFALVLLIMFIILLNYEKIVVWFTGSGTKT